MSVELGGGSAKDHSLAEALRAAGPHAVKYLYETFATSLFDYCASVLDDPLAACDTVQDGLVAVDARITAFPEPARLRVWLYGTSHRLCQRRMSGAGAAPSGPAEAPGPDELDLAVLDGEPGAADGELMPVVIAALSALPGREREALNLAFRHAITGADLARVLGLARDV